MFNIFQNLPNYILDTAYRSSGYGVLVFSFVVFGEMQARIRRIFLMDTAYREEMDLFAFIRHADPTKVRIGDHGDQNDNIENIGHDDLNEESSDVDQEDHSEESDHAGQDEMTIILRDEEVQAAAADKPKGTRKKRRATGGASGSNHPPKKLREDHGTSGNVSAITGGKSLAVIQSLLVHSTLNVEVGVAAVATVPFVTSSVKYWNVRAVVILIPTNAADAEVASLVRSSISPPSVMTAAVTTTIIVDASSVPALGLFAEFNVGAARQTCLGAEVRMRSEHNIREMKRFERRCDNARMLRLQRQSSSQPSFLLLKAAGRDGLTDRVSLLETTCSELHDQVSGYELFKEQCEAIQDAQLKVLSDHVVRLDFELMALALHLDEEFYPRFLTTIASWRWIIGYGLRLAVMKCRQSPKYAAAFGAVIGLAIDKEARYVSAVLAFCDLDFDILPQLESQKDASIADIMNSLCLEGLSSETLKVSRLQPAYEQLLLPIHRKEDNVVVRETSMSDSLNVVHDHVQKLKEGALFYRLSNSDAMGTLVDPLSSENLIGEASTSKVPAKAAATTALSISVTTTSASSILSISVADYDVLDAGIQNEAPPSPKIVFEKETLETTPENPTAS
ncbi:hypothetical protein Tco_1126109 [Tanacetum coccineum]